MTLKNLVVATAAALSFAAVPMASANNVPEPLANIIPGTCNTADVVLDEESFQTETAWWSWEAGGNQTQFGGGAVYSVTGTINELVAFGPLEVEVELTQLDGDLPMPTKMVYGCLDLLNPSPEAEVADTGTCEARISDVEAAITEATEEELIALQLLGDSDTFDITESELVGVFVKAMNPGVEKGPGGRQNYEKTDVCDVPQE